MVEHPIQPRIERERPRVAGLARQQDRPAPLFPSGVGAIGAVPPHLAVDRPAAARTRLPFPLRRPSWYVRPSMGNRVGRAGDRGAAGRPILENVLVTLTVGLDSYCDYSTLVGRLVDLGFGSFVDTSDQAAIESAARTGVLTMETMVEWRGAKADPAQALQWPRSGTDRDGLAFSGTPAQVVDCEVLLTGAHEAGPLFSTGGHTDRQVRRESSDDASIEGADPPAPQQAGCIGQGEADREVRSAKLRADTVVRWQRW